MSAVARSVLRALVLPTTGALAALSLAPFGLWPLEFVGLGALFALCAGRRARRRFARGWGFGLGYFGIGLAFVWHFTALGAVALVAFESCFFGLAALFAGSAGRPGAFAAGLVVAEWLRGVWPFGGVPVAPLALGGLNSPLGALARLGGPLSVTFAVGATGAIAAGVLVRPYRLARLRQRGPRLRRGLRVGTVVAISALCAATVAPRGGAPVAYVPAAAVQGGGARGLTSLESEVSGALSATRKETASAPRTARLLVWPEDVVALPGLLTGTATERELAAIARERDATLLVGVTEDLPRQRFDNEIVAFGPTGRVVATFEKVRPVPFGEFVPFRGIVSHFANLSAVPRDAVPGTGSGMIATAAGRLGILVSYETYFAARGRAAVRAGAEVLLTETNTASYATTQVPAAELAASRLQAIAEGRDLLQAATTGYSALITPTGAVRHTSALGSPAVVDADLPLRRGATVYEVVGDVPVLWLSVLLVAAGLVASRRRRSDD